MYISPSVYAQMTSRSPRLYQPAWEKIKRDRTIVIAADKSLHKRIFKGICKEKDIDTVYRYLAYEDGRQRRTRLVRESKGGQLIITLKIYFGAADIL